ncbi:hypothetical protein CLDAP_24370 [Caldilinea aerophila DSM 14535 = NBRC 104270]|uniref:Uncharacterized protein n=1 Tax=Caldilinea aerophila (strain DSM 14535 / JCM 11387 / NBRC 104270 / STL-6-O1) TaxID=926550 RepID=I0I5D9_CALAS|nr:hypothetical protein CLDAP_24370 [Caldilinea aerophila DSM 14535 = NBRC 104270]
MNHSQQVRINSPSSLGDWGAITTAATQKNAATIAGINCLRLSRLALFPTVLFPAA